MSAKLILIYLASLATFEKSYIFGAPKRDMNDVIWNFASIIFFGTLRNFYVEIYEMPRNAVQTPLPHFWGGAGLHIRSWETTQFDWIRVFWIVKNIKVRICKCILRTIAILVKIPVKIEEKKSP